jgi:hypothetical protein
MFAGVGGMRELLRGGDVSAVRFTVGIGALHA